MPLPAPWACSSSSAKAPTTPETIASKHGPSQGSVPRRRATFYGRRCVGRPRPEIRPPCGGKGPAYLTGPAGFAIIKHGIVPAVPAPGRGGAPSERGPWPNETGTPIQSQFHGCRCTNRSACSCAVCHEGDCPAREGRGGGPHGFFAARGGLLLNLLLVFLE